MTRRDNYLLAMTHQGRVALITGGGRGIGAAIARRFAAEGLKVAVAARSLPQVQAVAEEIGGFAVALDVTDTASVNAAVAATREALGPITVLVNVAGISEASKVIDTSDESWARVIDTNLTGVFRVTRAALPDMMSEKWGRVINVASNTALYGRPYIAAYAASKHGVIGLTRVLAAEVSRTHITVNAVCPGFVETDIFHDAVSEISGATGRGDDEARATLERLSPQRRVYQPDEVAHLCASLLPELAGGVTGQTLVLDGGQVQH